MVGINLYQEFLGEKATLDTVCDHIYHFIELDTSGSHIALGGDLDGMNKMPVGFTGVESYPDLADILLRRGLGEELVMNIFWNNALRVMQHCK